MFKLLNNHYLFCQIGSLILIDYLFHLMFMKLWGWILLECANLPVNSLSVHSIYLMSWAHLYSHYCPFVAELSRGADILPNPQDGPGAGGATRQHLPRARGRPQATLHASGVHLL